MVSLSGKSLQCAAFFPLWRKYGAMLELLGTLNWRRWPGACAVGCTRTRMHCASMALDQNEPVSRSCARVAVWRVQVRWWTRWTCLRGADSNNLATFIVVYALRCVLLYSLLYSQAGVFTRLLASFFSLPFRSFADRQMRSSAHTVDWTVSELFLNYSFSSVKVQLHLCDRANGDKLDQKFNTRTRRPPSRVRGEFGKMVPGTSLGTRVARESLGYSILSIANTTVWFEIAPL